MSRWTDFNNWVERHERGALLFIAILLFLLSLVLLSGCTSREQEQALSNARAGAVARQDPALSAEAQESIADGMERWLLNATGDMELPEPVMAPANIISHSATYAATAPKATDPPAAGGMGWIAGIGAAGLAGLGLLRFIPGLGGTVANLAFTMLAPKVSRETDRRAHELYQHGAAVVQYGVEMANVAKAIAPEQVKDIQDRAMAIQEKLGIRQTVEQLVAAAKAQAAASSIPTSKE